MGWLARLLGQKSEEALPLYTAVVTRARAPHWYLEGAVPDTVDGRFDMIAAILGLVVLRLEQEEAGAATNAVLTERFVDDMDGQLRELGVGDVVVGKHIGKMMGMLGGRLGAYRTGLAGAGIDAALVRNLYRGEAPAPAALAHVRDNLLAFRDRLAAMPLATLRAGDLP
jgi:cytochrome b pre-mRNA-processing protein 3